MFFRLDVVPVLFTTGQMATGRPDDLPYMVEQWDDADRYVEELIALTGDYRVARQRSQRRPSTGPAGSCDRGGGCSRTVARSTRLIQAAIRPAPAAIAIIQRATPTSGPAYRSLGCG